MDGYDIQFGDVKLKVNSIDNASQLDQRFAEFRNYVYGSSCVVGLSYHSSRWLFLCHFARCLMIDTNILPLSESLKSFLANKTICFVELSSQTSLGYYSSYKCTSCVKLGYLAARVLKKAEIQSYSQLEPLAAEVGIDLKPQIGSTTSLQWSDAMFFTAEQMKLAVQQVYYTTVIARKLVSRL